MTFKKNFEIGKNGHLALRGVDLVELCENYDTPLFVFDESTLIERFEKFRQAFENIYSKVMICYSVKTNNNLAICKIFQERGAYAEVSSELDLNIALKAGFRGDKILFDGPFKPKRALQSALKENVSLINVESFAELERLNEIAGEMGVKQSIGIRVNAFKDPGFSKYTNMRNFIKTAYCNLESRFGFSVEEAYVAFKRAIKLDNLKVEGILTHPYYQATKLLLPMFQKIREKFGFELKYLNIGGGFDPGNVRFLRIEDFLLDFLWKKLGRKSKLSEEIRVPDIESIAESLVGEITQSLGGSSMPTIVIEPGRFLTSSAAILLTRVDHVKYAGGYKWAIVDAGTNLLPRFGAVESRKIVIANRTPNQPEEQVNIVGPLLFNEDFISLKTVLPIVSEGDILTVFDCGAYTLSRSNQFLHPRPAAVLLNLDGETKVIREKETFEDFSHKDKTV